MDSTRRLAILAAAAAGLLAVNVVLLTSGDETPDVAVDAPVDDTDETGAEGADGDGSADGTDDSGTPSEDDAQDDTLAEDDETAGDEDVGASEQPAAEDGLSPPAAGTYTYASSGNWSLTAAGGSEEYELPATATAAVSGATTWTVELDAGDRYADTFTFDLAADGGLDWTAWVLERTFEAGSSEASYACRGDSAWYRPDEQGRVVEHVCEGPGITSTGTVEHVGSEDVTLGDGTVVTADRLLYAYSVSGNGVTGEGRFDLWLDPATGLRVREQRTIATTTNGTQEYREDVVFTLESLDPA